MRSDSKEVLLLTDTSWMLKLGRAGRKTVILDARGGHVVVQTMTTTAAADVSATLTQLIRLRLAGAELIRVTAPTLADARAFAEVMERFTSPSLQTQHGYTPCPVVADVHFSPQVALEAAKYVDAVRINPGNYLNRLTPKDEAEAVAAKEKMYEAIGALVASCRRYNVAVRIGVNHGSLAPRIIEQYGAGIEGMVHSAMEFLEVCRHFHFERSVVVSLKASEVKLMVFSNRRLVQTLQAHGFYNKIHLGVTEAGAGEDGRIKSAIGIGTLLLDGIGDTVRVSLTEDPAREIPFAHTIIAHVASLSDTPRPVETLCSAPPVVCERAVPPVLQPVRRGVLFLAHNGTTPIAAPELLSYGFVQDEAGRWQHTPSSVDGVLLGDIVPNVSEQPNTPDSHSAFSLPAELAPYFYTPIDDGVYQSLDGKGRVVVIDVGAQEHIPAALPAQSPLTTLYILRESQPRIARARAIAQQLRAQLPTASLLFWQVYHSDYQGERLQAAMGVDYGALLLEDWGNGLVVDNRQGRAAIGYALAVLQSLGLRRVHAEFVACPGCGRTLFDLESTFARVRAATAHLRDFKIAVMGCIVNGPGEMGDADYGYVGAGPGKITLYRAGEVARHNIPESEALAALLELIESDKRVHPYNAD